MAPPSISSARWCPPSTRTCLRIPLEDFQPLPGPRLASCLAYRTTKPVFGQERTIVITYNENLLAGQLQGIEASLTKARHKLDALQASLRRAARAGSSRGGRPRPNRSATGRAEPQWPVP